MRFFVPLDIAFVHSGALWLCLALPLLYVKARRGQRVIRTAAMACLILALAQPSLIRRSDGSRRVLVVDRAAWGAARSTREGRAAEDRLAAAMLEEGGHLTLIEFGQGVSPLADQPPLAAAVADHVELPRASLSAALDEALARIPVGTSGAVALAASGVDGDADWARAVSGFIGRDIPVSALALKGGEGRARLADLSIAPARVGERVRVQARLGGGNGDMVRLALYTGARRLALSAPFASAPDTLVDLSFPAEAAGFLPLRATLIDAVAQRDPGSGLHAVAAIQNPLPVLYLADHRSGAASHLQTLLGPGFAVEPRDPGQIGNPADWPAIMIDDLPAARLPAATQRAMVDAVARGGTGLFYAGGTNGFASGGYAGTPLADALPVRLRQEEKIERPSVALVVVIDTSGSMAGEPIDLAKQVARFAVGKLTPGDRVGVVEFYGAKQWAVPLQPASDIAGVERAIGRMQPQGSSVLYPAIQEAYYALKASDARFRHILVISDAGVEEQRYQQLLSRAAEDRITISTALVGSDREGEDRMAEWARWGHGRYYAVPDAFSLVELDLSQPQIKPSPAWRQERLNPVPAAGQGVWQGMRLSGMPPLSGHVPLDRRAGAETLLEAPDGAPLLASWQVGAGRVTALGTRPLGDGTQDWRAWRGYGAWLGGLLARTADQQPVADLRLQRQGDRIDLLVRGNAPPLVRLARRGGDAGQPVVMEERAPGLFGGTARLDRREPALVEARLGHSVVRGADRAPGGPDDAVRLPLDGLARLTGGAMLTADGAGRPQRLEGHEVDALPIARWLALAALALYLAELTWRRWPTRRRRPA